MVIDSSALIALLGGEAETAQFVAAIAAASSRVVGAPTYLEAAIVISARWGVQAQEKFDRLLATLRSRSYHSLMTKLSSQPPRIGNMVREAVMLLDLISVTASVMR